MPVTWRIRDRATFEALRRSGARARRGSVTVTYSSVGAAPEPRIAYAVGRRAGTAVTRNRLRRRLRAAVGHAPRLAPGAYLVAAGPEAV
ncbi:MAG TPA: ribonuclease P protein component, partial [Acidimicrobiaceae bacterium]|nr:ribonuclease P protein component [Acidimicrobiaceae bacterium]